MPRPLPLLPRFLVIASSACLLLTGCGSDRATVANANAEPTDTRPRPDDKQNAEALQRALAQHLDRIRTVVTNTALHIQAQHPDNRVRRACLQWQIRTSEVCLDQAYQRNLMVATVQTWYWTVAIERFFSVGQGKEMFGPHQPDVIATAVGLHQESEALAGRFLPAAVAAALKQEIETAAGNGDLFTATSKDRNNAIDQVLGATRLQSLFNLVLTPFDVIGSVSRGANSLEDMTRTADRAVVLAERYPQIIAWHLQMAAIEIEEQEAVAQALKDVHALTVTSQQLGDTVRDLPAQVRKETQTLLDHSGPAQAEARTTLASVEKASTSLGQTATAIDDAIKSLDTFVAHASAKDPNAPKPTTPAPPFRIEDYTAAAVAAESLVREIHATIDTLDDTLYDNELRDELGAMLDQRLAAARTESEALLTQARTQADQLLVTAKHDATDLTDHIAWRIAQLLALAAILTIAVTVVLRRTSR
jgi:hypothetical protein